MNRLIRRGFVLFGLAGPGYLATLGTTLTLISVFSLHGIKVLSPVVFGDAIGVLVNVLLFPWYWRVCERFGVVEKVQDRHSLEIPDSIKNYFGRVAMIVVNMIPGYLVNLACVGVIANSLEALTGLTVMAIVVFGDVIVNVVLFPYYFRLCAVFGLILTARRQ
jgi:hypothetical protein